MTQTLRCVAAAVIVGVLACGKEATGPEPSSSGSLVLSSASATFDATENGVNPAATPVSVTNGTSGTLRGLRTAIAYAPGQPTGWLTATLSATTAPSTLTLVATTGTLGAGNYTAIVAVTADGAVNGPQTIAVTFIVFADGIYVSGSDPQAADNGTCGLGSAGSGGGRFPCQTIAQGLVRAAATGRTAVLVADGIYDESVTLVNGISLLGGHRPDTWERHVATTNTVIQGTTSMGAHRITVLASAITSNMVLDGFVVRGFSNGAVGGNSYAIYVSSSTTNLVIRHNVVFTGRGGPGSSGATGANGAPGLDGGDRTDNPAAYDAIVATGTGTCNASNNRVLANGGVATFGADVVDGGRGGGSTCPPSSTLTQQSAENGVSGQPGAPSGGGANGLGGAGGFDGLQDLTLSGLYCFLPLSPIDGQKGGAGSPGAAGLAVPGGGSATGAVVGAHWAGASGSAGLDGGNGGGGGGGGAGGGGLCTDCPDAKDRLGGLGGGGGSGGEGGQGGGLGTAGGGAFALFVIGAAAPVVTDNVIVRGEGGAGGSGGNAGEGSVGGAGGDGGLAIFCTGNGGKGGDGGAGGHGSGGGGGSGGASYGIYTSGAGVLTYCDSGSNNLISGGAGGAAGPGGGSLINPGGVGQPGVLAACSFN